MGPYKQQRNTRWATFVATGILAIIGSEKASATYKTGVVFLVVGWALFSLAIHKTEFFASRPFEKAKKRITSVLIAVVLAVLFRLLPSANPAKTIVAGRTSEPITANPPIAVIPPVTKSTPEPRTYLVFDGMIRFFERKDRTGQLAPDQNLQIGDNFGFNYYFKAVGPKPVTIIRTSRWLYVESDFKESTQQQIIRDFKTRLGREQRLHQVIPAHYSLMAADGDRFNTVYAFSRAADGKYYDRTVTQDDLDGILAGTEIPFALIEISYTDVGKLHHLRTCQFLQPPGQAPGIWHICDFTFDSD